MPTNPFGHNSNQRDNKKYKSSSLENIAMELDSNHSRIWEAFATVSSILNVVKRTVPYVISDYLNLEYNCCHFLKC